MFRYFKPFSVTILQLFFFSFFYLKIVIFKENIGANCRMPGLCQIHIKGEIALCCQFFPLFKYPKDWYYISRVIKLTEFDAIVNPVLCSIEGPHNE